MFCLSTRGFMKTSFYLHCFMWIKKQLYYFIQPPDNYIAIKEMDPEGWWSGLEAVSVVRRNVLLLLCCVMDYRDISFRYMCYCFKICSGEWRSVVVVILLWQKYIVGIKDVTLSLVVLRCFFLLITLKSLLWW